MRLVKCAFLLWTVCSLSWTLPAMAADGRSPEQLPPPVSKQRANHATIGIVSGGIDGTYARIASDLASTLDEPGQFRILPILGRGSVQNLLDLMYLRGIDVGIVQSDVLAYLKRQNTYPGLDRQIQYIAKLYNEELHLLAAKGIGTIAELAGRKVNFDVQGSGTFMTASLVFETLGIKVEPTSYDQPTALQKLRDGEIAALVYVTGKPARLFQEIRREEGLHFLAVPLGPELLETYLPSSLTPADYALADAPVDTVAVGAVMAVAAFPASSERYRNLARFTEALFSKFPAFLQPPHHPKWREVNLAANLPGWTRFPRAEAWLRQYARADPALARLNFRKAFDAYLDQQAKATGRPVPAEQRDAMFQQFLHLQESAANTGQ